MEGTSSRAWAASWGMQYIRLTQKRQTILARVEPENSVVMIGERFGNLRSAESAVRHAHNCRSVKSDELAAPPVARGALRGHVREPILPDDGANFLGRRFRKRIAGEKMEHFWAAFEKSFLGFDGER